MGMGRKKQALSESDAVTLTKKQQRVVFSLAGERQHIEERANQEIREINEALEDLARMYAWQAGWEEEGEYYFDQAGPGEAVVLKRVVEEEGQGEEGQGDPSTGLRAGKGTGGQEE